MNKKPLYYAFQAIADGMKEGPGQVFDMSDIQDCDTLLQYLQGINVEGLVETLIEQLVIIDDRLDSIESRLDDLEDA